MSATVELDKVLGEIDNAPRWRKAWWWLERAPAATWIYFRYSLPYSIRNLFAFAGVIWRWRGWDYTYSYEVMVAMWERQAASFARNQDHTCWERDHRDMLHAAHLYRLFVAAEEAAGTVEEMKRAEVVWNELHDHLKANARAWWD